MKDFNKTDIPALDFMVKTAIEKGYVNGDDLIAAGFIELENTSDLEFNIRAREIAVDESVRLIHILDKQGICECFFNRDSEFARKNEKTFLFQKQGGFKALYADLKAERKREKLEVRKTEVDLDLAEKTLKEFPRTKFLAWSGFIIGVLLLLKELYIILKPQP